MPRDHGTEPLTLTVKDCENKLAQIERAYEAGATNAREYHWQKYEWELRLKKCQEDVNFLAGG